MTNKKYDVVALGELLIDFTENGLSEQGNPLLEANPGGAPCNVLSTHPAALNGYVHLSFLFFSNRSSCSISFCLSPSKGKVSGGRIQYQHSSPGHTHFKQENLRFLPPDNALIGGSIICFIQGNSATYF